ncbi:MAG: GDYXXLXY domain-containing protein [Candidatus Syntrophopropionicum ammoniitolerans]
MDWQRGFASWEPQNRDVYVLLEKEEKYWHAVGLYVDKPDLKDSQVFIKGRINYFDEAKRQYRVFYGIESYYVPEGTGRALQNTAAFEVLVRVDRFGSGVIEKVSFLSGEKVLKPESQ